MKDRNEQETFWEGGFGDDYIDRNRGAGLIASNTALFAEVLRHTGAVSSVLELGSNIGLNLVALRSILPRAELTAVEINGKAAAELRQRLPDAEVENVSILDFRTRRKWDLVFTKTVLIHINPDDLSRVYELMYEAARRYVMVCEYYNPAPVEVNYRGHQAKLFKRDFAGEMLQKFPGLQLLSYGFAYHRDRNFPQDDMTWFLMEKGAA